MISISKIKHSSFPNFPENFRCNLTYYKSENFSFSSLHHIFESENFGFPFFYEKSLAWGVKCEKLNSASENRRAYVKHVRASNIAQRWKGHREIFSPPQVIENSTQYLLLRTDILQKTVVGCPWWRSAKGLAKVNTSAMTRFRFNKETKVASGLQYYWKSMKRWHMKMVVPSINVLQVSRPRSGRAWS